MADLVTGNVLDKPEEFARYYEMAREIVRRWDLRIHNVRMS